MTDDRRVFMLNALWFKAEGGRESYRRYAAAMQPILAELGAKAHASYRPEASVIGDFDPDLFFLVEWPDVETFESLLVHEGYGRIRHLRENALEKSLLIRCRPSGL